MSGNEVDWSRRRYYPVSEPFMRIHNDGDALEILIYDGSAESEESKGKHGRKYGLAGWCTEDLIAMMALCNAVLVGHQPTSGRAKVPPHGFTWEDVDCEERTANDLDNGNCGCYLTEEAEHHRSIAARIAALLPPRDAR